MGLPNANNGCEALFSDQKIRFVHRGINEGHREKSLKSTAAGITGSGIGAVPNLKSPSSAFRVIRGACDFIILNVRWKRLFFVDMRFGKIPLVFVLLQQKETGGARTEKRMLSASA